MRLTIIGCSGSMSGPQSSASSYLVQADGVDTDGALRTYSIVLDLGPGSMGQLLRHLDPAQLDAIAISHCHADHMVDLVGMHVYRRWLPTGALGPVACLGPSELLERLQGVDGVPPQRALCHRVRFRHCCARQVLQRRPHGDLTLRGAPPGGGLWLPDRGAE